MTGHGWYFSTVERSVQYGRLRAIKSPSTRAVSSDSGKLGTNSASMHRWVGGGQFRCQRARLTEGGDRVKRWTAIAVQQLRPPALSSSTTDLFSIDWSPDLTPRGKGLSDVVLRRRSTPILELVMWSGAAANGEKDRGEGSGRMPRRDARVSPRFEPGEVLLGAKGMVRVRAENTRSRVTRLHRQHRICCGCDGRRRGRLEACGLWRRD